MPSTSGSGPCLELLQILIALLTGLVDRLQHSNPSLGFVSSATTIGAVWRRSGDQSLDPLGRGRRQP